jgi:hypothetical protein
MNHRYLAGALFLLSLLGILLGYVLLWHPDFIGICPANIDCLSENLGIGIAKPLYWSTRWLPVLFFGLMFVSQEIFWAWVKFIRWVVIIPLVLIFISPNFHDFMTPDRTEMTAMMVKFIVGISGLFIAYTYWHLHRQLNNKP